MSRTFLLGIFGGVVVGVVVVAALFVTGAGPGGKQPGCSDRKVCSNPPGPPTDLPPALLTGQVYTSPDLGYQVEFNSELWAASQQDGTDLELASTQTDIVVHIHGVASSDSSSETLRGLMDERVDVLNDDVLGMTEDSAPEDQVLQPSVGYRRGVGRVLTGTLDTPQGPGGEVAVIVMAAGDGQANVVLSLVVSTDFTNYGFYITDSLMNTFLFPSEAGQ
jgi:hypothetical protein